MSPSLGRLVARALVLGSLGLATPAAIASPAATASPAAPATPATTVAPEHGKDPLLALVRRIEHYLRQHEVDGVTMDWRYQVIPSEEIRQTVVCQVLSYAELERMNPSPRTRQEIVEHADFLLGRLEEIRSHSPFDGMLAYCLLSAYETTGEARFLEAGRDVNAEMLAIPTSECVLNGGLMVAMGAALDAQLGADASAAQKARDILQQLEPYQNPDGSFPHWCGGSRDIHYTGWMAMELVHLARLTNDPTIEPMLARMNAFMEQRIAPDGRSIYEEPCPNQPGCTLYYDSRRTGCDYDYDTRGWTVEPAYQALLFDHERSPKYGPVIRFLDGLEERGTIPDLYDYWPPPSDPEYPWTIADTSVVNMSIIFWVLATDLSDRAGRGESTLHELAYEEVGAAEGGDIAHDGDGADDGHGPGADPRRIAVSPNPSRGRVTLSGTADVAGAAGSPLGVATLAIHDVAGRLVRRLELGARVGGAWDATWDGTDAAGRAVPPGLYFARVRDAQGERVARVLRLGPG